MGENSTVIIYSVLGVIVTQLFIFLTLVFNSWSAKRTALQNRQWEIEDRKALAQHVVLVSTNLAAKVVETSTDLAKTVTDTSEKLAVKVEASNEAIREAIAENTAVTKEAKEAAREAYTEANNVNMKIAEIGIKVNENLHKPH